ncbi:MAG: hypothetical protein EZS28_017432, partial [Streblomastix strix]
QSWLDKREVKGELNKEQVWRNKMKEKVWSADKCSKGVKQVLAEAGIEGYNITSIRKASISETIDKNMTQIQINRWSGHSDASATVRVNYDTNNNDTIRNIQEQAGKQPSVKERCLLFKLYKINREARIRERIVTQSDRREGYVYCPVGNAS